MTRVLFVLTVAGALPAAAQQVPVVRLARPAAAPTTEFTEVTALLELAGGRLLVADETEQTLLVLNMETSATRSVGRIGSGPGEYRSLGGLIPRSSGGAFLLDYLQRRLLPVDDQGRLLEAVSIPRGLWTRSDSQGRLFGSAPHPRRAGAPPDSAYVIRWDPTTNRIDTLLSFRSPFATIRSGERRAMFRFADAWAVLPEGDIVLLEPATYRMRRFGDRIARSATAVPWTPIRVTDDDKQRAIAAHEARKPRLLGGGDPAQRTAPPTDVKFAVGGYDFPEHFPAIDNRLDAGVQLSPAGHLWVARMAGPDESAGKYDVLSRDGTLLARIELPNGSTVKGFGRNAVYVTDKDSDDVLHIRKYSYPVLPT